MAQARDEQVFAKDRAQAEHSSLRRRQQRNGLRRMSNCVVQLRRASVEHRTLLHHLGEFQARVEEKLDAQESRMTAAQKASEILMAMGRAKGRQREAERTGVQLVQLVPPPAPPWMVAGLQVGPRPPKKDSRQRRRSRDSLC